MIDRLVMDKVYEHWDQALDLFNIKNIVGLFLQGSQNYGLNTGLSDVDTKLIITPSFTDIMRHHKPTRTAFIRENGEHIDIIDVRLFFDMLMKQNFNTLEILYTDYCIINPLYQNIWETFVSDREKVAHYNEYKAIKTVRGMAQEKYKSLKNNKDVVRLLWLKNYVDNYISGEPYEKCLRPGNADFLKNLRTDKILPKTANTLAKKAYAHINLVTEPYKKNSKWDIDDHAIELRMEYILKEIMKIALKADLEEVEK